MRRRTSNDGEIGNAALVVNAEASSGALGYNKPEVHAAPAIPVATATRCDTACG
jgi:hypothetical protein